MMRLQNVVLSVLVLAGFGVAGCDKQRKPTEEPSAEAVRAQEESSVADDEAEEASAEETPAPAGGSANTEAPAADWMFTDARLYRPESSGEEGRRWQRLKVTASFAEAPGPGISATLLPRNGLPPLSLSIKKVSAQPIGRKLRSWTTEFEPITDPKYRDAETTEGRRDEYPFAAVVVHPKAPDASLVEPGSVDSPPEKVTPKTIAWAVDIDADDTPDAFLAKYDCKDRKLRSDDPNSSDYTCSEVWIRHGDGWKMRHRRTPA